MVHKIEYSDNRSENKVLTVQKLLQRQFPQI